MRWVSKGLSQKLIEGCVCCAVLCCAVCALCGPGAQAWRVQVRHVYSRVQSSI